MCDFFASDHPTIQQYMNDRTLMAPEGLFQNDSSFHAAEELRKT